MGKQRKASPKVVNKNLKALIELQWRLSEGMKVSGSNFMKEHRLSGSFFMIIKKKGIIKKSGGVGRGKNVSYTWETKQPDRAMAKAVTECMATYNRELAQVRAEKKAEKEAHTWVEEVIAESKEKAKESDKNIAKSVKGIIAEGKTQRPDTMNIADFPVESEVVKPELRVRYFTKVTTIWFGIFKKTRLYESSVIER